MVRVRGGSFRMGSQRFYPEERPVQTVAVEDFWIDATPVTNEAWARFVSATGYLSSAERETVALTGRAYPVLGSMVFTRPADDGAKGTTIFTAQEQRGLNLFNDPQRGNCASCHSSTLRPGDALPVFTNFGYFALGVPRNTSAATADPAFFDMGLCGPVRTDLANRTDLCGMFKVPTLRNVALTAPYFHNGALSALEDVVAFYATRDSDPARWYPTVGGVVQRFNDLPPAYRGNVTRQAPFGPPPAGGPRLSPQDVQDIASFLRTLTDGFVP